MVRLSIPVRQALARLTLPVLVAAAFGLMLLGKADLLLAGRARMALADAVAPIFALVAEPLTAIHGAIDSARDLLTLRSDNARLRAENEQLRQWQAAAMALDAENATLKANLRWIPDPAPSYVTARVVADAGGVYARAVLLSIGPNHSITKGQIALDERGLVGRVTELGTRSARVLLVTDMNSRIPVILEGSRARAILVGTNGPRPRLLHWPEGTMPVEGERVVTSAEAQAFPAGLPVGVVPLQRQQRARGRHSRTARPAGYRADLRLRAAWRAAAGARRASRRTTQQIAMDSQRTPGVRPRPTLWRQLDAASRQAFPAACTALLLLLAAAPLGLPGQAQLQPAAALACVFFWSVFRPGSMPPPVVFLLGLFCDLLSLAPPGVAVLFLLVTHGLAVKWRRVLAGQAFLLVWLAFIVVAAGAAFLEWLAMSLLSFQVLPGDAALFQFALTAGLYPMLAALFTQAHRGLANPDQA